MSKKAAQKLKTLHNVQVTYKSGAVVTFWAQRLEVKHNNGVLVSLEYEIPSTEPVKPLYFGDLSRIESVYQIESKQVVDTSEDEA